MLIENSKLIADRLLAWYRAKKRDLPWRHMDDPYHIWVSEIMLQQTQVNTVIPYFERFIERFPTVRDLAEASLDEVLALWQGLGYYSRGRNLYAAAQDVFVRFAGELPQSRDDLLSLAGIGAYTAGAILSIAFGQDEPAIDGNAVRVLCRLFAYEAYPGNAAGKRAMDTYARALMPSGEASDFNQGLMDLGATHCSSRSPACDVCPLDDMCEARERGIQGILPVRRPRRAVPHKTMVAALCEDEGSVLILRRRPDGLLGGLWELPGDVASPESDLEYELARILWKQAGLKVKVGEHLASVDHAYTHFRITVHVYRGIALGSPVVRSPWDRWHWMETDESDAYGLTGVTSKILARVPWAGSGLLI